MPKILLPFNDNPPLKNCFYDVHSLGMIFTQPYDKCITWMLNHCYSFIYDELTDDFCIKKIDNYYYEDDGIILLSKLHAPFEIGNYAFTYEIFLLHLKIGCYCTGLFNPNYITKKNVRLNENYDYPYIIYGYDDEKDILYGNGYLAKGLIENFETNYRSFYEAVCETNKGFFHFDFVRLNKDFNYDCFDKEKFKEEINDLLSNNNINEGLNVYNKLHSVITNLKKDEPILLKPFDIILELNHLMYLRLQYIAENNIFKNNINISFQKNILDKCHELKQSIENFNLNYFSVLKDQILENILLIKNEIKENYEIIKQLLFE